MSVKTRYIYGTEAEKLYAAPKRRPEQEEQRRPERKPAKEVLKNILTGNKVNDTEVGSSTVQGE